MVMNSTATMPGNGAFGTVCSAGSRYSEILYIVILTIICAIYTLYVVFVLIWLHLAFIVIGAVSRKRKAYQHEQSESICRPVSHKLCRAERAHFTE